MPELRTAENLQLLAILGALGVGMGLLPLLGIAGFIILIALVLGMMWVIEISTELTYSKFILLEVAVPGVDSQLQLWLKSNFVPRVLSLKPLQEITLKNGNKVDLTRAIADLFHVRQEDIHRVELELAKPCKYKNYGYKGKVDFVNITFVGRWEDRFKFRQKRISVMNSIFTHPSVEHAICWEVLNAVDVKEGVRIPELILRATCNGDYNQEPSDFELDEQAIPAAVRPLVSQLRNLTLFLEGKVLELNTQVTAMTLERHQQQAAIDALSRKQEDTVNMARRVTAEALANAHSIDSALKWLGRSPIQDWAKIAGIISVTAIVLFFLGEPQAAQALGQYVKENAGLVIILAAITVAGIYFLSKVKR